MVRVGRGVVRRGQFGDLAPAYPPGDAGCGDTAAHCSGAPYPGSSALASASRPGAVRGSATETRTETGRPERRAARGVPAGIVPGQGRGG